MEKQKVYYKVVETTDTDGIYTSYLGSLDTSLQYQLFEKTVPVFGKLFLFSDKQEALEYSRVHVDTVLEGTVEGNVYIPEELTFGYMSLIGASFKLFWELVEQAKTEEELRKLCDVMDFPGLESVYSTDLDCVYIMFADDFTPMKVISE